MALHGMIAYLRNEQAIDKRSILVLQSSLNIIQATLNKIEGELQGIGYRKQSEETMTTTQKFNLAMEKRFTGWTWYRDRVLAPTLAAAHTIVLLALLALAFGVKMP